MPDARHTNHVNLWMKHEAKGLAPEQLVQLFEQAMGALWRRAHLTLGEVTLAAIVDRVLHNAAEKYPLLESLEVEAGGVNFRLLSEAANNDSKGELTKGIRFVLVEFFVVIGNLTAEVLTPALHSELSKVVLEVSSPGNREPKRKSG